MSTHEPYLVLTKHEIERLSTVDSKTVVVESDCACSEGTSSFSSTSTALSDLDALMKPDLHMQTLDEQYVLVFNSIAVGDAVVLNARSLNLLNQFNEPSQAMRISQKQESPDLARAAIHKLTESRLLVQAGQEASYSTASDLLTVWLHITNDCNLRCPYCYVSKTKEHLDVSVGKTAIDTVFRTARMHNFNRVKLKYAGGEATLRFSSIIDLQSYASKQADANGIELDAVLLSNGIGITDKMIDALRKHSIRLMISLDGIGEFHNTQRSFENGVGSYVAVERTLKRLARKNFVPTISVTVSNRNIDGLPEVVAYALQSGLPFSINFFRDNDCSSEHQDLQSDQDTVIQGMKKAFAVIEANLPNYSLLDKLLDLTRLDFLHERTCGVGDSYMVIDQYGKIAKCHMELNHTVSDIWDEDPLLSLRNDKKGIQNLVVAEKEGCRECDWRYICTGGCPALTYRATGRFDVKSPNCRIYKALFPDVLRLEGLRLLKYGNGLLN